jgi:2-oxoglutarate ferredoxin oxidoreductase subunit delta
MGWNIPFILLSAKGIYFFASKKSIMAAIGTIVVDIDRCKGCGLCIEACPQKVLGFTDNQLNIKGYRYVGLVSEGCTGCTNCAIVCPDRVITVYRQKNTQ